MVDDSIRRDILKYVCIVPKCHNACLVIHITEERGVSDPRDFCARMSPGVDTISPQAMDKDDAELRQRMTRNLAKSVSYSTRGSLAGPSPVGTNTVSP